MWIGKRGMEVVEEKEQRKEGNFEIGDVAAIIDCQRIHQAEFEWT